MINLYDILDAADGQLFGDPAAQIFSRFSFDVRQVRQGDLFVALKTEQGDGHHFMEEAVRAGAIGLMCTHPPSFDTQGITVMMMRDVEAALMRWTKFILTKYETTVIAVTGDRGKSTACHAIAQVLSTQYTVYLGQTTLAGRFGIPLALSTLGSEHQLVVLELDPQQPGDMEEMLNAVHPSVGVVINVGGGMQDNQFMETEAANLINKLPENGLAVLNYDDPAARRLSAWSKLPPVTFSVDHSGTSFGADLTAYNLVTAVDKTGFDLRYKAERFLGRWIPLLGTHQLYAVLPALAVGLGFSISLPDALNALTHLEPLPGRMRSLNGVGGCLLVDDSFSASLPSLQAALKWIRAVRPETSVRETVYGQVSPRGNIYIILGDVDGLDKATNIIGEQVFELATGLVTQGEIAAQVARSAVEHGLPMPFAHITYTPQDAAHAIKDKLGPKDVVLVVGDEHAQLERVVEQLLADPKDAELLARHQRADVVSLAEQHTLIQVDIEAIAQNVHRIRQTIGSSCKLMAVVKADAYGHGVIPVSTTAIRNGADYLGVATLEEAIEIRQAGITAPILVLGYVPPQGASLVVRHDLAVTVYETGLARVLNRAASGVHKRVNVHVRVDVGAGGIGVLVSDAVVLFRSLMRMEWLNLEGIYTTLNLSGDVDSQLAAFEGLAKTLQAGDFKFEYIHAAGSSAALNLPQTRLGMVRCGSALYGLQSSVNHPLPEGFLPALVWKTTVAQVKRVQGRLEVDEQGIPTPTRTRTVAILPVGQMDGLPAKPKTWGHVLIHGKRAEVIGAADMQQTLVDVSPIDDVRVGDEVVLLGKQDEERITPEEIARSLGIRPDELLATIAPRLPRRK
jgi:alanine racemase